MSLPRKNLKSFTLIELLVVIAILGILSAAILVAINPTKRLQQARDTQRKNDFGVIARSIQGYMVEHQGLVPLCPGGTSGPLACSINNSTNFCTPPDPGCASKYAPDYLKIVPQDPVNSGTNCSAAPANPPPDNNRRYMYCYRPEPYYAPCVPTNTCTGFLLYACLEDSTAIVDSKNVFNDNVCPPLPGKNFSFYFPP